MLSRKFKKNWQILKFSNPQTLKQLFAAGNLLSLLAFFGGGEAAAEKRAQTYRSIRASYHSACA